MRRPQTRTAAATPVAKDQKSVPMTAQTADFIRLDAPSAGASEARRAATPSARQVALVPGALVPILTLDLPKGLRGETREQVARRQLGDLIGQGVEAVEMRPFYGPRDKEAWTRALVVGRADMERWRGLAGQACRAVLPDYLALPAGENVWTVSATKTGIMARLGPEDGFSAPRPAALAQITRALAETAQKPHSFLRLGDDPLPEIEALAEAHGIPVLSDIAQADARVLAHGELAFDLRRNPQAARTRLRARLLPWRWPAIAALIAAGIWAATQMVAIDRLTRHRADLTRATTLLVREHFVPTGPILDIRTQVARALADRQAATNGGNTNPDKAGFLDVFGRAAPVLAREGATIDLVRHNSAQGLRVQLVLTDFAALDRLVAALQAAGLTVLVAQSRAGDSGAEAELRISGGTL